MKEITVGLKKLSHYDESFKLPKLETQGAAGIDIKACLPDRGELIIKPFERVLIPTGMAMAIPMGYELQVRPRSGLSYKTGLMMPNSIGTIDSDYRGEIKVLMANISQKTEVITHGMRVAQILLRPTVSLKWEIVDELDETLRGEGGFGSTGVSQS